MASTMLRALRVTPDLDVPPPSADEAPAIRAAAAAEAPARLRQTFAVAVGLGAREHATAATAAFSADGAIVWRPDALGIAVAASYSPSVDVASSKFTGAASDDALAALARLPIPLGDGGARAIAQAGMALHAITLRGTPSVGGSADVTRYDPAVRAGCFVGYALDPSVDVGVAATLDYLVDRQRFEVQAAEFLTTPRVELSTTLVLTLRVL